MIEVWHEPGGKNGHDHIARCDNGYTTYSTDAEAVAQIVGLVLILNGSPHEVIRADQHTFKFLPQDNGIRIDCDGDEFQISWQDGEHLARGFCRTMWNRRVEHQHDLQERLLSEKGAVIHLMGEEPPFLANLSKQISDRRLGEWIDDHISWIVGSVLTLPIVIMFLVSLALGDRYAPASVEKAESTIDRPQDRDEVRREAMELIDQRIDHINEKLDRMNMAPKGPPDQLITTRNPYLPRR